MKQHIPKKGGGSSSPGSLQTASRGSKRRQQPEGSSGGKRGEDDDSKRRMVAEQRRLLPIASAEGPLVDEVRRNETLIIVGETGSGKTTQLPQYLLAAGFSSSSPSSSSSLASAPLPTIAVTQPRRVAAVTVAARVAEEMGVGIGQEVGYCVRFEDLTSAKTRIKFMTDGMLLREALLDPLLHRYAVIIVDEAHERTIHTDMLLGLLKKVQKQRRESHGQQANEKAAKQGLMTSSLQPLKLVVMSATLDFEQFERFFPGAKAVYVAGRQYPVEVFYTHKPEADYVDAALITILQIHLEQPSGDILVFLTGQEDIESLALLLQERASQLPAGSQPLAVAPIYAALPTEKQLTVFKPAPHGARKVVLATNIAETSLTIPGIRFVIDPGLVKARAFDPRTGMESLAVVPVSKSQARQRSGRAGREGPGRCYRLFTEATFESLAEMTVPEIKRCNLTNTVLQLKALGIDNILKFDFMDPPPRPALLRSLEQLFSFGALDASGHLTDFGRQMSRLPLDPLHSKAILEAAKFGSTDEMLAAVAMMSAESVFFIPRNQRLEANAARKRFESRDGDHMTAVNVLRAYASEVGHVRRETAVAAVGGGDSRDEGREQGGRAQSFKKRNQRRNKQLREWCRTNFLNGRALAKGLDVYGQLKSYCESLKVAVSSCGSDTTTFRQSLAASYFCHAAKRQPDGTYKVIASGQSVSIHPSSVLFGKKPDCVVFNEQIKTSKEYIRDVTQIDYLWLPQLAPHFYRLQKS